MLRARLVRLLPPAPPQKVIVRTFDPRSAFTHKVDVRAGVFFYIKKVVDETTLLAKRGVWDEVGTFLSGMY
jgi:hypothetical protein